MSDESKYTDRSLTALRSEISHAHRNSERWTLFGIGIVSLHILQIVFMQATWTKNNGPFADERWANGWQSLSKDVPGNQWLLGTVIFFIVSIVITFVALGRRSHRLLRAVTASSFVSFLFLWAANAAALGGTPRRWPQHGITLMFVSIVATGVIAAIAASHLSNRAPSTL